MLSLVQCSVECSTEVESHSAFYGAACSAVLTADSSAVGSVPLLSAVIVLSLTVQCAVLSTDGANSSAEWCIPVHCSVQ